MKKLLVLASLAVLASCSRLGEEDARRAVHTYLDRLVLAYRAADASLVDPLVGDVQGTKLLGLIGVKHDAGVVLDAKLLELQFTRVERNGKRWIVETNERWYYRDRKITTGEQQGEDSLDSSSMRYAFEVKDGRLILEDLEFVGKPVVGRKSMPMPSDPKSFHGIVTPGAGAPASRP